MLYHRSLFQFTCLNHGTPGDKLDKRGPKLFCKSRDDCMLECFIAIAVADYPCEAGIPLFARRCTSLAMLFAA